MRHVGIDLHKMESQICVLKEDGTMEEKRISTRPDRLEETLKPHHPARVLLESATESEWVARHLEACGFEVVVADPNYAPMYAYRSPRIKTDRRDARALAEACRAGTYRHAHRRSQAQREIQSELMVRDTLVRSRSRQISVVRAELRRNGWRMRSGHAHTFLRRVGELDLPSVTSQLLVPLLASIDLLTEQIHHADQRLAQRAAGDPLYERLQTVPGIGPVTSVAFVATLDDVTRFDSARQVRAYLGLVPRERSSGEIQRRGHITKAGNSRMRWLLIEAAWRLLRSRHPSTASLQAWTVQLAGRRGRKLAVVALARRLAGILYALWRDESDFTLKTPHPMTSEAVA